MTSVLVLYNEPVLPPDHADYASEAGVLEAVRAVEASLIELKFSVSKLGVGSSVSELTQRLAATPRPELVFNLCEGLSGVGQGESQVAGLIELFGWPMTGNASQCLALVRDKPRTKTLLRGAGIPTPEFVVVRAGQLFDRSAFETLLATGRVIVKPAAEDASLGIDANSVVADLPSLERQAAEVAERYGDVLIERFIAGREFNVAVLALPAPETLPIGEIQFSGDGPSEQLVTYDAKWAIESDDYRKTPVQCPANLSCEFADRLRSIATAAFSATGCRSYGRIDFRVDAAGQPYVLEVNANPDISPSAGLACAAAIAGMTYTGLVERIVEEALLRAHPARATAKETNAVLVKRGLGSQPTVSLRSMRPDDISELVIVLERCGVFRPDEIEVGREVLESAARQGPGGDYYVIVAEHSGKPVGWACYGLVPLTDATFDLYWIAVDPHLQGSGVGRQLIDAVVGELQRIQARWLLAETSAASPYEATQQFYRRTGFELLSSIPDFYRAGDGRLIFGLRIRAS